MGGTYPKSGSLVSGSRLSSGPVQTWSPDPLVSEAALRNLIRNTPFRPAIERITTSGVPKIPLKPFQPALRFLFRNHPIRRVYDAYELVRNLERFTDDNKGYRKLDTASGWFFRGRCNAPNGFAGRVLEEHSDSPAAVLLAPSCIVTGVIENGTSIVAPGSPVLPSRRHISYIRMSLSNPLNGQYREEYSRPNAGPNRGALAWWQYDLNDHPWPLASVLPQFLPINKPAPAPVASPDVKPRDDLKHREASYTAPGSDAEESFGPKTRTAFQHMTIGPHKRTRPGRRVKESKFQGAPAAALMAFRALSRLKESLTELNDFLDSLLESLPKDLQKVPHTGKFATPQEKLAHLHKHWDKVDAGKAIAELIQNEIEDRAIGRAIAASDKAARKLNLSSNLATRGAWLSHGNNLPHW